MRLPHGPYQVTAERDLAVPVAEGVVLLTDHYAPAGVLQSPTVLVRSPYGRRGPFGMMCGYVFAEHGFHAVVQSVRGGFGSGGVFDPLGDEREDGLATVDWLKAQPWFDGSFAMYGPSYLGFAQWAIAADAGPELKAMATQVTASQFRDAMYYGGGFALESTLTWVDLTTRMKDPLSGLTTAFLSPRRARRAALSGRPLSELDALATGAQVQFFQDVLENGPGTPFWKKRDFSATVAAVTAPVNMMGGWYDIVLPGQLQDYASLRAAGRRPHLTIGCSSREPRSGGTSRTGRCPAPARNAGGSSRTAGSPRTPRRGRRPTPSATTRRIRRPASRVPRCSATASRPTSGGWRTAGTC